MKINKVFTFARIQKGMNDFYIPFYFVNKGFEVINIDDRIWLWPRSKSVLYKIFNSLLRPFFVKDMNAFILNEIKDVNFKFAFIFKGQYLKLEVIKELKKNGAKILLFYPDLEPWSHGDEFIKICKLVDYFIHTKKNLHQVICKKIRSDALYFPHFYSEDDIVKIGSIKKDIDISFVGHYSKEKLKNIIYLSKLLNYKIFVYGDRWPSKNLKNVEFHAATYGVRVKDIISRSKISLGFLMESLSGFYEGDVLTSRTILIPLYGTLCLHERNTFSIEMFENDSVLFSDLNDLAYKINNYISKPELCLSLAKIQQNKVLKNAMSLKNLMDRYCP
jgi:hypothetical protein